MLTISEDDQSGQSWKILHVVQVIERVFIRLVTKKSQTQLVMKGIFRFTMRKKRMLKQCTSLYPKVDSFYKVNIRSYSFKKEVIRLRYLQMFNQF